MTVALSITALKAPFDDVAANALDYVYEAGTVAGNHFVCTGREILLVKNGTGTNTFTVTSVADEKNRTEDLTTYSLATTETAVWCGGLTNSKGWKQTTGYILVTPSSTEVSFAVLRLPAGFP